MEASIFAPETALAAINHGLPIVMKTGRLEGRRFVPDAGMTQALAQIVDVEQAEAAVADDRDRILTMVRDEWGGCHIRLGWVLVQNRLG